MNLREPLPAHARRVVVSGLRRPSNVDTVVTCLDTTLTSAQLRAEAVRGGREVKLPMLARLDGCGNAQEASWTTSIRPTEGAYVVTLTLTTKDETTTHSFGTVYMHRDGKIGSRP